MNVGTYLLLTVPLVGGSLYVYDSLRPSAPAPAENAAYSAPAAREPARAPADGPTLSGDPAAQVERQVERLVRTSLERWLEEQRARRAAGDASVVPGTEPGSPGGSTGSAPAIDLGADPLAHAEGAPGTYDERTLKVFRAYLDEAQRREREERMAEMVGANLDRLGVTLSEAQKKAVVDITVRYQNQRREAFRGFPPGQDSRDGRQKAAQELQEAYSKAVYDAVPAAEAEKIVNALGAFRGGFDGGPAMGPARPRGGGAAGEGSRGGN